MATTGSAKPKRGLLVARVASNRRLCREHYLLRVAVPGFAPSRPGQFVQLRCCPYRRQTEPVVTEWRPGRRPRLSQSELLGPEAFLRRPLSLAGARGQGPTAEIELVYRTVGTGTNWLAGARPGELLDVLGPLGNGFTVRDDKSVAALVGGGVGIPPMLYLASALTAAGKAVTTFSGARTKSLLPLTIETDAGATPEGLPAVRVAEYPPQVAASIVTTDDGSLGMKGLVGEALKRWLEAAGVPPSDLVVYSCGPEAMMQAVGRTCIDRGIACQLAFERYMGCGTGTCQSCVVKVRDDSAEGWSFKLCCRDGPVFEAGQIVWD